MKALLVSTSNSEAEVINDFKQEDLKEGEVLIEVYYSSLNYKDALALTGKGQILRKFPLVPGIDLAGVICKSSSKKWKKDQAVIVTGCGLGENFHGGFQEFSVVNEKHIIPLPDGLSLKESMTIGTAGFTAALALFRMEKNGQSPSMGPLLITGASGGVGQLAIQILSQQSYNIWALSSKKQTHGKLVRLGASKTLLPDELPKNKQPLGSSTWAGGIDNLGGETLATLIRHTDLWGNIASIGLAETAQLNTTVIPHILRGVSLLGISSTNCPYPWREEVWKKLGGHWKPKQLDLILEDEINLDELLSYAKQMLDKKTTGRTIVKIK